MQMTSLLHKKLALSTTTEVSDGFLRCLFKKKEKKKRKSEISAPVWALTSIYWNDGGLVSDGERGRITVQPCGDLG